MCVVLIYSECSHATLKCWLVIFLKVSGGSSKVKCVFVAIELILRSKMILCFVQNLPLLRWKRQIPI